MVTMIVVAAVAVLALATQAGVLLVQRAYPAQGEMIEVKWTRVAGPLEGVS